MCGRLVCDGVVCSVYLSGMFARLVCAGYVCSVDVCRFVLFGWLASLLLVVVLVWFG